MGTGSRGTFAEDGIGGVQGPLTVGHPPFPRPSVRRSRMANTSEAVHELY